MTGHRPPLVTEGAEGRSAADEVAAALRLAPTGLWVAGSWRDAADGMSFDVEDPGTGAAIASVADATPADGLDALAACARRQTAWASTAPQERAELLHAVHDRLLAQERELGTLITLEMGKPLAEAIGEVRYAAGFFRWFAEEAVRIEGRWSTAPAGTHLRWVLRTPVGPALAITPWNFPLAMGARKLAPAIAAGCTSILKPAPQTPLSSLALAQLMEQVGLPAGVVNVIPTSRASEVVSPLLADPRLRKLTFTGSTAVGRLLLSQAGDNVLRTSMELGGSAPFIVCDDADIEQAVGGAMQAKMRNMGQACTAANRFYVQERVLTSFVDRLARRMEALTVGHGLDRHSDVGPLVDTAGLEKVERLVSDAVADGASIRTGGARVARPGHFYAPTVVTGIPGSAQLGCEEIFGPVAAIQSFVDDDEVVERANDTPYGLVAYVYTQGLARALRFCERLEVGMVGLNRGIVSDPAAPFGGVKHSGLGREGARDGLDEFLETKTVAVSA